MFQNFLERVRYPGNWGSGMEQSLLPDSCLHLWEPF